MAHAFDLNVEKVLEHWTPAHALREIIANALDEHAIVGVDDRPEIAKVDDTWIVRDKGRGVRYQHLTQNESDEKREHDGVVGQFGVGLKDALATFHRNGIGVHMASRHGDIGLIEQPKHGFGDVVTLHAVVEEPTAPDMVGTAVSLTGLDDAAVAEARSFFLAFDPTAVVLDTTAHGQVLARAPSTPARVYVRGVRVADDDGLLFSYNVTKLDAKLRKALNRERANVGRSAYTDRVKAILLASRAADVHAGLAADMGGFAAGATSDEVKWNDVAEHVVRHLAASDPDIVFVTAAQRWRHPELIRRAQEDGKRVVVVPDALAKRLDDPANAGVTTLDRFAEDWNRRVVIVPIPPDQLRPAERDVLELAPDVMRLAGYPDRWAVIVSETLHLTPDGRETAFGLWEPAEQRIVVNRKVLKSRRAFVGTLLHEITHAATGTADITSEFEEGLTDMLGVVGDRAL